jgi:hypothetical protein
VVASTLLPLLGQAQDDVLRLKVVGGLADVSQYRAL